MPFKIHTITARTQEAFKLCEEGITYLNTLIQTLNGKEINVNVNYSTLGIEITPDFHEIKDLRVVGDSQVNWVDYEHEKNRIFVNTKTGIFQINLKVTK